MTRLTIFISAILFAFQINAQTYTHPEGDCDGCWGYFGISGKFTWTTATDTMYVEYNFDTLTHKGDSGAGQFVFKKATRKQVLYKEPMIKAPLTLHNYGYKFDYAGLDFLEPVIVDDDYSTSDTIHIKGRNYTQATTVLRADSYDYDTDPCIAITTSKPVLIENCVFVSAGDMISSLGVNGELTVRNCVFIGLEPTEKDAPHGRAVAVKFNKRVILENNYLEQCRGFYVEDSRYDEIRIRYNKQQNVDGRFTNTGLRITSQSPASFVKIRQAEVVNFNISWNEIINYPDESAVNDIIGLYKVISYNDYNYPEYSTLYIDNNFIYGHWSFPLSEKNSINDGVVINLGGNEMTEHARVQDNVVVAGRGIRITNGKLNYQTGNRLIFSGEHPNGSEYKPKMLTFSIEDGYEGGEVEGNSIDQNHIQFPEPILVNDREKQQVWTDQPINTTPNYYNNTERVGATLKDEQDEYMRWRYKAQVDNGFTIGPKIE